MLHAGFWMLGTRQALSKNKMKVRAEHLASSIKHQNLDPPCWH
jgi:hypothetical protein